jgi:exopolyphosphatase / guanosine-5'-triphosphate,3'-diphosphate pyrophosphatase
VTRRVGAIDLGTNSTRLLVADIHADGTLSEVDRRLTITGLGRGVDAHGALADDAIRRVRACLDGYRSAVDRHGVGDALAVATSAVRDASNGPAFLEQIGRDYGLTTRLLDGRAEAELTFRGVTSDRSLDVETLVVDIGGGSTELLLGGPEGVSFATSLQMGCVRMTERFLPSDPPTATEIATCADHIRLLLPPLAAKRAVGVAGTVTTAAALDLGLPEYDAARIHRHTVGRASVAATLGRLAALPLHERERIPGLEPERAPVIVAGLTILREILATYGLDAIEASERDILHGAALSAAESLARA